MKRVAITLSAVALLVLVTGDRAVLAQAQKPRDPAPAPTQQPKDPAPIQGELSRVDADAKLIAVKLADGTEMEFSYNDATEVSGAKEGVAGLATMKASRVTVHFKEDAQARTRLATRILVEPKK